VITLENRFLPVRSAVCFFVEGGIILLSVLASFSILHKGGDTGVLGFQDAIMRGVVVAFFCQTCMYMLDMYDLKLSQSWGEMFFSLVFAVGIVCIGIGIVSYAFPGFGVEGNMYYLTVLFVAFFLLLWRISFDIYLTRIAPRENILVLGTGEVARLVGREIITRERLGLNLLGFVGPSDGRKNNLGTLGETLSDYPGLVEVVRKNHVRKIVVAVNERRGGYPLQSLLDLRASGCDVLEWPGFFEKLAGRIPIDDLSPSYFIFQEGFRKSRFLTYSRRIVSLMVSTILLVTLLPILLLVAVLIKFDSPGPVFYTQERVGRGGRTFRIFKFRSMRRDAEGDGGPRWASAQDDRITRIGNILRRTRLDEVPQLINVMKGDMNLVGPRPERPLFVEQLTETFPFYALRHTIPPGLTGWAQVMFMYCGTFEESKEKLQYDLFYIKNLSLKMDLLILFKTIKIVLLGRGSR
jgi:sugar transferase (PEP-CTERM system associated)